MAAIVAMCLIASGTGEAQTGRSTIRAKATVVSTTSSYAYDVVRARAAETTPGSMGMRITDAPDPLVTITESIELRTDEPVEQTEVAGTEEPLGRPPGFNVRRWRVIQVQFLAN
jgi:hypothetical protein